MSAFKQQVKRLLPSQVVNMLKRTLKRETVEYWGDFLTWDEACKASGTYSDPKIFERVKEARMKVLRGEAAYERDSVTFSAVQYSWPVLSALLIAAARSGNQLNLLDYGGSLGTSYFQNKELLSQIRPLRWNIIEQEQFVEFGRRNLQTEELHFYTDFDQCMKEARPTVFFISSVLQYLPHPYVLLERIRAARFKYIIFDRTTVLPEGKDRIVVQNVPRRIYPTDFPARLFNEKELCAVFAAEYKLLFEFFSIGDPITLDRGHARNKGYCFERSA